MIFTNLKGVCCIFPTLNLCQELSCQDMSSFFLVPAGEYQHSMVK